MMTPVVEDVRSDMPMEKKPLDKQPVRSGRDQTFSYPTRTSRYAQLVMNDERP